MQRFRKLLSFAAALLLSVCFACNVFAPLSVKADTFDDIWDYIFEDEDYSDDYYSDDDYEGAYTYDEDENGFSSDSSPVNPGNAYTETRTNQTTGYRAMVYDNAGLFTQTEAKTLLDEIYNYTEYGDMVVLTTYENRFGNSLDATDDFCEDFYQKFSKKDNCVIFIIDMKTRYLLVYSAGSAVEATLTGSKCDTITDNVYSYASDKNYYECASKAYDQIGKVLAGMHIAQPMKVVSNVFIALVIGFVVMYLIAVGKSSVSKTSDSELLKFAAINFNAANPSDTVTNTTKTYCPRSSGSSGGRSGGGGGGGHSHSSGGHRF